MTLYPKYWQVLEISFNTKRVKCEAKVEVTVQGTNLAWVSREKEELCSILF